MDASYVFRVRFTLSPRRARIEPDTFETVLRIPAPPPGEEGWLLFRDALWRGEANDAEHVRRLCADRLPPGVGVLSATFSGFETDDRGSDRRRPSKRRQTRSVGGEDITAGTTYSRLR